MNITTFNKVLLPILEAGITPWVWGLHAKGKTETIQTFYRNRGWMIFNFRLNTQADVGDFLGLQDFVKDKDGNSESTKFCMPEWLNKCIKFCLANPDKRAAVFIDEMNRAARFDLLGPVFQMSLDRWLHTTEFPKNLDVIVAANPPTKDYKVLNVGDRALLSRFWHVFFSPSAQEWRDYAISNNYDAGILGFLQENPEFLEDDSLVNFSVSDYAKPDRRKWGMVDTLIKSGKLSTNEQHEVFGGLVGVAASLGLEAYYKKMDKPLTATDVIDSYPAVRTRIIAAKSAANTRTDILGVTAKNVVEFFKDDPALTEVQGTNVISFIKDLPNDDMFKVMHAIYRKRKFHDFCEANTEKLKMIDIEKRLEVIRQTVLPETLVKNT